MPDFNTMQRQRLAARNQAMPDGGFPIRNVSDLKNAIQAYGRAKNKPAVKAWIKKRAKQLGREDLLPDNWRVADKSAIVHFGIKGMKWGIRRYQNEDGSLTSLGRQRLYGKDVVVRKGTKIQRISTSKEDTHDNSRKHAYGSYTRKDKKRYEKDFGQQLVKGNVFDQGKADKVYKITYKANKDLVSPSKNQRIAIRKQLQDDPKTKKAVEKGMLDAFKENWPDLNEYMTDKEAINYIGTMSETTQQQYFGLAVYKSKPVRDAYFKELSKRSYNAVVDDVDSAYYAESALIVIDRYKDLKYSSVKDISKKYKW